MKILIVDEHSGTARGLRRSLERLGHRAFIAADPLQALGLLDHDFDAVISDVEFEQMSGADLAHAIRFRCPLLPVVFYTVCEGDEDVVRDAARVGHVMSKSYTQAEIAALTDTLVALRKAA